MEKPIVYWITLSKHVQVTSFMDEISRQFHLVTLCFTAHCIPSIPDPLHALVVDLLETDGKSLNTIRKLQQNKPVIPIIILTESASENFLMWALRAHISDVLRKPVRGLDVVNSLHKALADTASSKRKNRQRGGYTGGVKTLPALEYIATGYHLPISLSEAAMRCHMGSCHFCRTFREEQGTGFKNYLIKYRLKKSVQLLHHTNKNIAQIATEVGFSDHSHYSKMFKRHMGKTPKDFRSRARRLQRTSTPTA